MKIKNSKISIFILFICIFFLNTAFFSLVIEESEEMKNELKIFSSSSPVGIVITQANIASYDTGGGDGSLATPYIIEDLDIDTSDSIGISFASITSYFIVQNCTIKANTYGIYLGTVSNGRATIRNCELEGNFAIGGLNTNNVTIFNNTLVTDASISFSTATYLNFTQNRFYAMDENSDILYVRGDYLTFNNNKIYGNQSTLQIANTIHGVISNNQLYNAGFNLEFSESYIPTVTVENNLINGKPFGYLPNQNNKIFSGEQYGQLYFINSSEIKITDYSIEQTSYGIYIDESDNIEIINCDLDVKYGIFITSSSNIAISSCIIESIGGYGIYIEYGENCSIEESFMKKGIDGIYITESNNLSIYHNNFDNVTSYGLEMTDTSDCVFAYNILTCYIQVAEDSYVTYLDSCDNITFFMNIFINSGPAIANLTYDDYSTNINWYNNEIEKGNYWSNWNGTGPYWISQSNRYDMFPLYDIDGDLLNETQEVLTYKTDPYVSDTDSDGLIDGAEIITYDTDPLTSDTDNDGMPDKYEVDNDLNPNLDDTDLDADNDGLTNLEEYEYNTNPNNADSDGDGFTDKEEIDEGTDPNSADDYPSTFPYGLVVGLSIGFIAVILVVIALYKKNMIPIRTKSQPEL